MIYVCGSRNVSISHLASQVLAQLALVFDPEQRPSFQFLNNEMSQLLPQLQKEVCVCGSSCSYFLCAGLRLGCFV